MQLRSSSCLFPEYNVNACFPTNCKVNSWDFVMILDKINNYPEPITARPRKCLLFADSTDSPWSMIVNLNHFTNHLAHKDRIHTPFSSSFLPVHWPETLQHVNRARMMKSGEEREMKLLIIERSRICKYSPSLSDVLYHKLIIAIKGCYSVDKRAGKQGELGGCGREEDHHCIARLMITNRILLRHYLCLTLYPRDYALPKLPIVLSHLTEIPRAIYNQRAVHLSDFIRHRQADAAWSRRWFRFGQAEKKFWKIENIVSQSELADLNMNFAC